MIDHRIKRFFNNSDSLSDLVTRKLSHIKSNWELVWDDSSGAYVD
jgi:hypothetical protein